MTKKILYLLTGPVLVILLTAIIFILRSKIPAVPSASMDSHRAKGPKNAPIQIIEYSDFQCPACKAAQSKIEELFKQYPNTIRLIFFHFPLEGHQWSPVMHRAAECASFQDRFWPYHDKLYAGQEIWSKNPDPPLEAIFTYAKESQLPNLNEFARCLGDIQVDKQIFRERETGFGLGVRSTPSFFVNGDLVVGADGLAEKIKKIKI